MQFIVQLISRKAIKIMVNPEDFDKELVWWFSVDKNKNCLAIKVLQYGIRKLTSPEN